MRFAVVLCIAAAGATMFAPRIYADDANPTEYVELGSDMPEQDAQKQWDTLSTKYKSLLGSLHYYPKKVLQAGTSVATRIQAGPISGREKAEKLCRTLFAHDIPCFVIEGVNHAPPSTVISLVEKSEQTAVAVALPWHSGEQAAAVPENTGEHVILPWLVGKNNQEPTPAGGSAGKVEVAEAVRVPLTDMPPVVSNAPVDATPLAELRPMADAGAMKQAVDVAGWLHVEAFPDDDMALAFWQGIRETVPDEARSLHVRMVKPFMANDESQTSLNIGPFARQSDADAFCTNGVQTVNPTLSCSYVPNATASAPDAVPTPPRYAHGDEAARSQEAWVPRHVTTDNGSALGSQKQYWVQVLSAGSQMEALQEWEKMRVSNSDLLDGKRSSISASMPDKDSYVVRVGPIADDDDALDLCSTLKTRGVDCRVLSYSNM